MQNINLQCGLCSFSIYVPDNSIFVAKFTPTVMYPDYKNWRPWHERCFNWGIKSLNVSSLKRETNLNLSQMKRYRNDIKGIGNFVFIKQYEIKIINRIKEIWINIFQSFVKFLVVRSVYCMFECHIQSR
jgi:hypothetical protein